MSLSVLDIFKIGIGPSSSHTMGPMNAACAFVADLRAMGVLDRTVKAGAQVYGSLALTGKGHCTDRAILLGLEGNRPDTLDPAAMEPALVRIRTSGHLSLAGTQAIEFDEPMDGIVYMMACGTGFAVWANYHWFLEQDSSVYLSTAAAKAVVVTLAHASFAGALGYIMGRAKFSRRSAPVRGILLFAGLLAAAALNGQFAVVEAYVSQSGMAQHPWRGVGYAALCASAVFLVIWYASQRLLASSPFRGKP